MCAVRLWSLGLALLLGCSAPATLPELVVAEKKADAGDTDGAVAAYRLAQSTCHRLKPPARARAACGDALLGEGETLEHAGRTQQAIDAYLAIPPRTQDDPTTAAGATFRAGKLLLRAGKPVEGWTALWRTVTDWPDEPVAVDALHELVVDGRGRDAHALAEQLAKLLTPLAQSQVADNMLWALADLQEHELANPAAARGYYDRIPLDYPDSGLRDDARWHGARLSRALGDSRGAIERLRALLATREVSIGVGSYFSVWLDDAQLELGKVLRDDLHDLAGAAAAFRRLPRDYPASTLRDDALYELAVTLAQANDHTGACAAVRDLRKLDADSKYLARAADLGCKDTR
jgi:tetratricopeptide (TPR) repeat protein